MNDSRFVKKSLNSSIIDLKQQLKKNNPESTSKLFKYQNLTKIKQNFSRFHERSISTIDLHNHQQIEYKKTITPLNKNRQRGNSNYFSNSQNRPLSQRIQDHDIKKIKKNQKIKFIQITTPPIFKNSKEQIQFLRKQLTKKQSEIKNMKDQFILDKKKYQIQVNELKNKLNKESEKSIQNVQQMKQAINFYQDKILILQEKIQQLESQIQENKKQIQSNPIIKQKRWNFDQLLKPDLQKLATMLLSTEAFQSLNQKTNLNNLNDSAKKTQKKQLFLQKIKRTKTIIDDDIIISEQFTPKHSNQLIKIVSKGRIQSKSKYSSTNIRNSSIMETNKK